MIFLKLFAVILPWRLKYIYLNKVFKYNIDKTANIGFAWIFPAKLEMSAFSTIGHFSVAIHLDKISLREYSSIGRSNWITGFSTKKKSKHFEHQVENRESILKIGSHSAITKHHHLDCTNKIEIGNFTTVAGYHSQLLTHSINIYENRQDSHPITIGDYCFIGTNVVILGGSNLPSFTVLGAKSLLNKKFEDKYYLYAGVPAEPVKSILKEAKYFNRGTGFVN
jgi:acetyltransferase-like isoleucine patch superfamily enzyme